MKMLLYGYVLLLITVSSLEASYTFRICYPGSDDPEVVAPDSITVNSVINGGSTCWAPAFSVTVNKGEYQDVVIEPGIRTSPAWNCHIVPETVNGSTVRSLSGYWPSINLEGLPVSDGETWQIIMKEPVTETLPGFDMPGMSPTPVSITIQWFAQIQDGIQACSAGY